MKALLVFGILLAVPITVWGQWQQLSGPFGGGANSFAQSTNTGLIYAATPNGLYVSRTHGQSWELKGLQGLRITTLAVFENADTEVFLAVAEPYISGQNVLYRSTDSAASWDSIYSTPSNSYTSIVSLLQDNGILFAVLDGWDTAIGILKSNDFGRNWNEFSTAPPQSALTSAVVSGNYIVAAFNNVMWRIPDTGGVWSKSQPDTLGGTIANQIGGIVASDGDTIIAVSDSLYFSTDHGATWQHPSNSNSFWVASTIAVHGQTVVAANLTGGLYPSGIYLSTDFGGSWNSVADFSGDGCVAYIDGNFLAGSSAGIMSSLDGRNWNYVSAGESASNVYDLCSNGTNVFALTDGGVFRSTNHGDTWISPSDTNQVSQFLFFNDSVYADVWNGNFQYLTKWNGSEWDSISHWGPGKVIESSGVCIAASNGILFRSTDGARTWDSVKSAPYGGIIYYDLFMSDGKFYACYQDYSGFISIYKSTDLGLHWDRIWNGEDPLTDFISSSAAIGDEFVLGCKVFSTPSRNFARTTDAGNHWQTDTLGLECVKAVNGQMIGAIETKGLMNFDRDSLLLNESNTSTMNAITTDEEYMYIGTTDRGIWRAKLSDLSLGVSAPSQPVFFNVFPNPSSSQSTISFSIPDREHISLALFDALGIERAHIFEGELDAGNHAIPFAYPNLADGLYEIVLTTPINRSVVRLLISH